MHPVLAAPILLLPLLAGCLTQAEQPDPEPIPAAMPHHGDKGLYTLLKAPLSEEARQQGFSEDRLLNISFEFEGASVYHDRDGKAHAAWDLLIQMTDEQSSPWASLSDQFHIDSSTLRTLGTTSIRELTPDPHESTLFPTTWRSEEKDTSVFSRFDVDADLPCGLLESWQGGHFPSPGSVTPATVGCSWAGLRQWGNHSWVKRWNEHGVVVQDRTADGAPWVVVDHHVKYVGDETDSPGPAWRAWYDEGIPYPVRMQDLVGGNFGAPGDELVLTHFERGKNPHPTLPSEELRDLPPLVKEPLTRWIVPDLGIQHPWPLREAYAYARDDPNPRMSGFREFLELHPEAYLASAWHFSSDGGGSHSEHWAFIVVDEDEHFFVSIAQERPLGPEPGPATYRYDGYGVLDELRDSTWPAKELLPKQLPTPQSLLTQWEVAMGETGNPAASPSYSISIHCPKDCQKVSVTQAAGAFYHHSEEAGVRTVDSEYRNTRESSGLYIRDGALSWASVSTRVTQGTAESLPPYLLIEPSLPDMLRPDVAMLLVR